MTWNRRLVVIGLLAVLVCMGVGLAMLLTPDNRPGVTKANFDKLQVGMNRLKVQEFLGTNSLVSFRWGDGGLERWVGEDGARIDIDFSVRYGDDWILEGMTWTDSTETTWQRIRRWLRLRA